MASFQFELVAPERMLFSGPVDSVIVPGAEGDFQVLAGHTALMSTLKAGIVSVSIGGVDTRLFILGGFADVGPNGLTILAEQAIPLDEVKRDALDAQIKGAEASVAISKPGDATVAAESILNGLRALRDILPN
jgi:F-type H+-transporting ATPase subunit epsilon